MHPKSGPRRRHSDELKAKVLAACDEPSASISGVALAHGLNTNLVRKWRTGRGFELAGTAITPAAASKAPPASLGAAPEFVAIEMPAPPKAAARAAAELTAAAPIGEPLIQIELRRGPLHLNVRWPTAAAEDCRAWLRELSSGLLK
jgi:transposase